MIDPYDMGPIVSAEQRAEDAELRARIAEHALMCEYRSSIALPSSLICKLRAIVAEYDPETTPTKVITTEILEVLGNHLNLTFMEEEEDDGGTED